MGRRTIPIHDRFRSLGMVRGQLLFLEELRNHTALVRLQPFSLEHKERILQSLEPIRWKDPSQFIEDDEIIPIRLKTGIDYENVVNDVVGQLAYVAELLKSTG